MNSKRLLRIAGLAGALILGILVFLDGCSGGGSSNTSGSTIGSTMTGTSQTTAMQLRVGDSPADSVVAFEITINSVVLNGSGGSTPNLLPAPEQIELTHTAGTVEPLAIANVAQGTYTSATIAVSNPEITVINPQTGQPQELTVSLTSPTVTINFNPPLTVGMVPSIVNFDLDLAKSITIGAGVASIMPTFTVTVSPVNQQEQQQEAEDGEVEDLSGAVTSVSNSSFMISGFNQPIGVNSSTVFEGITSFGQLTVGTLVEVDGVTQSDGSILATKVQAEMESEAQGEVQDQLDAEGLVTSVTGNPVSQFQIVAAEESSASGVPTPALGSVFTVNVDSNTAFSVDQHDVDLSNLPFQATFDASTLGLAQRVEADTDTASATTITAKKVKLKIQALSGTVSNLTAGSGGAQNFTLTVASDSAFAVLTGKSTVTVFQPAGAEMKGMSSVANGSSVRVRGLLFFNGSSDNLVAKRIVAL